MVPALRADQVDDLQQARVPGTLTPVRARLPRRRHAQRAEARRAFRRGRLPDDDPVQAGRHRDHAAAGRCRHRAVREDPRRRAGRCATGERDSRRRSAAAARSRPTTGSCWRITRGAPTTAACCRRISNWRRLPRWRDRCPAELPGECARFLFDYLGKAADAAAAGKPALDGLARADHRRQLLALLPLPSVQAANVDNLLYGPKDVIGVLSDAGYSGACRTDPRLGRCAGAARHGCADRCPRRSSCCASARDVLLAKLEAPGSAAAAGIARRGTAAVAKRRCRDARQLCAAGGDQCGREPVLGGGARRRGEHAADSGAREIEVALLLHARPGRPGARKPVASRKRCSGSRARMTGRRARPRASSGATTTWWACSR